MEIFKLVFSPIEVNTYILADKSGKCAVIDCGCYDEDEFNYLTDFIKKKGLEPVLLLNTHCHLDHIFGNGRFMEKYNLASWSHHAEEKNRIDSIKHAAFFGLTMAPPPEPAGFIGEGQTVTFGSESLDILHVPGHSPGGLAFLNSAQGILFSGDTLFAGTVGRSDLPGGNGELLISSIKEKLLVLPPDTRVYPGHGEETTIGNEISSNTYLL